MKDKNVKKELTILFWVFIIGSIAGFIFEVTVVFFQKGHFELRQGLIYGPFIPVYGIGAMCYYIVLSKIKIKNKIQIFLITMILGGITEYLCSLIQEKAFGTISWDYSYLPFNINGRISLLHCIYWGIGGVLYITYIDPFLNKMIDKTNIKAFDLITIILSIFIIFDISISWMAADRQTERKNNIEPENRLDIFLDKNYPDEYMNRIFNNKKDVCIGLK